VVQHRGRLLAQAIGQLAVAEGVIQAEAQDPQAQRMREGARFGAAGGSAFSVAVAASALSEPQWLTILNHLGRLPAVKGFPANYWRLLGASAVSNLADGVFFIVLPLLAVRLTDSPLLIAGLAIAARLPWLFFVLVAGALADRLDRRATMRNVQLFRMVVLAGLTGLALVDALSLPVLYATALASASPRRSSTPRRSRSCRRSSTAISCRARTAGSTASSW
jgi:hypothetical protein